MQIICVYGLNVLYLYNTSKIKYQWKNILFIIVAFLSFSKTLCSQEVKEVVVSFNMNDFNLVYNELIIETGTQPAIFKSDITNSSLFEWNENGNELIGEPSDNVNLAPSIFVTRAPLRTSEDIKAFVDKLIFYEVSW